MADAAMLGPEGALRRELRLSTGYSPGPSGPALLILLAADFLFTQTVINGLSTASWRGVWNLLDLAVIWLFGGLASPTGCLASCSLGLALNLAAYGLGPLLDPLLAPLPPLLRLLLSRLYTAAYFTAYMLLWSGFWNLFTVLFPTGLHLLLSFSLAALLLIAFGCFNTVNGVPATVGLDWGPGAEGSYCAIATLLEDQDRSSLPSIRRTLWAAANWLATAALEVLGIEVWHAAERSLSGQLPAEPQVSLLGHCLLSVLLGCVTGVLALLAQLGAVHGLAPEGKDAGAGRRLAELAISSLGLVSSVFHWYGVWTLLDSFLLTDQEVVSNLLSGGLGIAGLCILGASKSLHGGLARDCVPGTPLPLQPHYLLPLLAARAGGPPPHKEPAAPHRAAA